MKFRRMVFISILFTWFVANVCAADTNISTGLVVRSPFFGVEGKEIAEEIVPFGSFSNQLGISGDTSVDQDGDVIAKQRILMAISNVSYPVTPGDSFRLLYTDGVNRVTMDLQVDGTYHVDIPAMGTIDASKMTFPQLKEKICSLVGTYYSYANPQLSLIGTGSFYVTVKGEVASTDSYPAWGLSRLSSVVSSATNYASSRDVMVTSLDGTSRKYDLYKALREGDLSQDPFLKAGDVVTIGKAERIVTLSGKVFRPGTYQLLKGEDLKDLVTVYGGGLMPGADIQHVRVQRFDTNTSQWNATYVDLLENDSPLSPYDQIVVDPVAETGKTVTIEGAIRSDEAYDPTTTTAIVGQVSGRIFYQFYPGETLQQMMRTVQSRLMTSSDFEHAYLVRDGKKTMIDLRGMLSGADRGESLVLQADDQLTIPFAQRFVSVSGAVARPGTYAYVPDKTTEYYLAIAGGATADAYKPITVSVTAADGAKVAGDSIVGQEYSIRVKENTFVKDLAPAVAIVGLVGTMASILYNLVLAINGLK